MKSQLAVAVILGCVVPSNLHPVCAQAIGSYLDERADIDHVIFVCNMVSSRYIPMVECFRRADED